MKVSPSILTCDFAHMAEAVAFVEQSGADWLHLDVMDGVFVPNLSFGVPVIASLRPLTTLTFDVHLMMEYPDRLVEAFAKAGADLINFHIESAAPTAQTIEAIHRAGCRAALTVKPNTPIEAVFSYLDQVEMVLIMTVEPGFGGQSFMENQLGKVTALREECARRGLRVLIEVDGGVNDTTAPSCAAVGVDVAVVGSALFKSADPKSLVQKIQSL